VPATLYITELPTYNVDPKPPVKGGPDISLPPTFGSVTLKTGFTPDPYVKKLTAGGPINTKLGGVNAFVAKAPDFKLHYTAGDTFPLIFHVRSEGDTTLLINLPNGTWIANDDGGKGLNPMLRLNNPMSGRYDIYVGTFGKTLVPATLFITELPTKNVDKKK
jgi:serine protease Do